MDEDSNSKDGRTQKAVIWQNVSWAYSHHLFNVDVPTLLLGTSGGRGDEFKLKVQMSLNDVALLKQMLTSLRRVVQFILILQINI